MPRKIKETMLAPLFSSLKLIIALSLLFSSYLFRFLHKKATEKVLSKTLEQVQELLIPLI